jgi:hypothetical protein
VQVARLRIGQHDGANYIVGCGVFAQGRKRRDGVMYLVEVGWRKWALPGRVRSVICPAFPVFYFVILPFFFFPNVFAFSQMFRRVSSEKRRS